MSFTAPVCEPSWALPAALIALGVLSALLGVICRPRKPAAFDPHGDPYGDQPQVPSSGGGGAGDRHGGAPSCAGGDRPVRLVCHSAALLDLAGVRIARISIVADETLPQIVMFEGEPFLRIAGYHDGAPGYAQVRPFHAIAMVEDLRR